MAGACSWEADSNKCKWRALLAFQKLSGWCSESPAEGLLLHGAVYTILYSFFLYSSHWSLGCCWYLLLVLECANGGAEIQQTCDTLNWSRFAGSLTQPVPRVYQLLGNFRTPSSQRILSLSSACFFVWFSPSNVIRICRTHSGKLTRKGPFILHDFTEFTYPRLEKSCCYTVISSMTVIPSLNPSKMLLSTIIFSDGNTKLRPAFQMWAHQELINAQCMFVDCPQLSWCFHRTVCHY